MLRGASIRSSVPLQASSTSEQLFQRMAQNVIFTFLCARESWIMTAELEKGTQTSEMRCYRKIMKISYADHVTNEKVAERSKQP